MHIDLVHEFFFIHRSCALLIYIGLSLSLGDLTGNIYLNVFLSGATEIPAVIIVNFLIQRLGRKPVLVAILLGAGILAATSVPFQTKKGKHRSRGDFIFSILFFFKNNVSQLMCFNMMAVS